MLTFWDQFWPQFWANFIGGALIVGVALLIEAWLDERRDRRHKDPDRDWLEHTIDQLIEQRDRRHG